VSTGVVPLTRALIVFGGPIVTLCYMKATELIWRRTMARPSRFASMSVEALMKLRGEVEAALGRKADELTSQLSKLNGNAARIGRQGRRVSSMKGRRVPPKYRSKANRTLTWAGRGATPRWMREEMKKRKLKKEAFLIK
jgi:DNA-binding protein H-NS